MTLSKTISEVVLAFSFVCLFSLAHTVFAQEKVIHSLYTIFFETTTTRCNIEASAEPEWHVLRIQMKHNLMGTNCSLSQQQTLDLLSTALNAHKQTNDTESYDSLTLGNIENYAWIQHYLIETAKQDKDWAKTVGKSSKPQIKNNYVSSVLSSAEIINVFNLAGNKYGYRFSSITCEQVFVSYKNLPTNAICSIKIVRN